MTIAPEYVAARRVLLDALDAIGNHRRSVVLVGAQAVYLHAGDTGLAVAVMTADSDLVLEVPSLAPEPELAAVLRAAGFVPGRQPGSWLGEGQVAVDLMVVPHQSNRARAAPGPLHCTLMHGTSHASPQGWSLHSSTTQRTSSARWNRATREPKPLPLRDRPP